MPKFNYAEYVRKLDNFNIRQLIKIFFRYFYYSNQLQNYKLYNFERIEQQKVWCLQAMSYKIDLQQMSSMR